MSKGQLTNSTVIFSLSNMLTCGRENVKSFSTHFHAIVLELVGVLWESIVAFTCGWCERIAAPIHTQIHNRTFAVRRQWWEPKKSCWRRLAAPGNKKYVYEESSPEMLWLFPLLFTFQCSSRPAPVDIDSLDKQHSTFKEERRKFLERSLKKFLCVCESRI